MALHDQEPAITTYVFGPYRFIPQRQLLLREGVPVRIGGRAFDILTLLVRRAGSIVSKNELLTFCWPRTYVEESNLKVNMAALRRILDDGSEENYIATVTGRGYRFVADLAIERQEPATPKQVVTQAAPILKRPNAIGRTYEMEHLVQMLPAARCLTIVGPGGVGKTTIALCVAHYAVTKYQHVFFVDLSTVGDVQYAMAAVAAGVGARQRSEDTLSEIVSVLEGRHTLLVLDNCEHLFPTVPAIIARLLEALPTLTVLATSREQLQISCEQQYRLPNLIAPPAGRGTTAAEALEFSAVQLFVDRANERSNYVLSDEDAPLVSAICRRLDGIPLAIQLVASKTFAYGLSSLLTMLEQKFLLLSNGERTAPLRQQTLLATMDWSYRLLSEEEASLLRLLSVFAGPFRLQDAVAMAEAIEFDTTQTVDGLERLASKSLVSVDYQNGSPVYRLLEATRAFASERLKDAGERDGGLLRHAWQMLSLFEKAANEQDSRDKSDWMAEYAHRVDDARNAMAWAFTPEGDQMLGVRLTAALIPLWYELSSLNEMQSRVERALLSTRDLGDCPMELTMKLIAARASGMTFAHYLPLDTEAAWKECYRLGVASGNAKYQIFGLWGLCSYLIYTGRPREGLQQLQKFIALAEAQSDRLAVDEAQRNMATAEIYIGDISSALSRIERLTAKSTRSGDPVRFARFQAERGVSVRCTLSLALWVSGDVCRAMEVARAAVERAEIAGHVVSHTNALAVFAVPLSFWSGDYDSAQGFLAAIEANSKREDIGVWREWCRFFKSAILAKRGEPGAVAELAMRLKEMIAARHVLRAPMHYSMVAEAQLEAGCLADARATIDEALRLAIEQDANWALPEILRIAALLDFRTGASANGTQLLLRSIREASCIGALTLELRSALTLALIFEADGRHREAFQILDPTCAKFDTRQPHAELTRARALLDTLASAPECGAVAV
ncbi:winged helix-turn-helix domain-containing protein [Rhizobium calliandrae]|uniref:Winged helix-turn-helix domain-containing protein n=1 Tax=Rhizobium calliandrae TaxID=1312182 RepID=A0ABT7KH76_9HYPH|nr:winged helix-turn-helix domain-containing protein [Rhizobium calliandrae]MDL2407771.1 winged helix-turn-helix domain-containing protein [Rhizobium calliandrae]